MKETTQKFLLKASRAIRAAENLLKEEDADFAAGRVYYGMFYVAQALLYERGLRFRKHSAVHAAFGEHFAKGGQLDPKFHRFLIDAFDKRIRGDYDVEVFVSSEDVTDTIQQAREFLQEARKYLESSSH